MNKSKRKSIKNIILAILTISTMLMVSGCISASREIEFTKYGLVKGTIDISAREDYVLLSGMSKDEFVQDLTNNIGSVMDVSSYQKTITGINWYGAKGTITLPKAQTQELFQALLTSDVDVSVVESGFFVKYIKVDITNKATKGAMQTEYGDLSDIAKYDGVSDFFSIKVPYKIQSTNGIMDPNDPTRATWDLYDFDMKPGTKKSLTISYINPMPIIVVLFILGVILIILPAIIIPNAVRRKKKVATTRASFVYPNSPTNYQGQRNYNGPMVYNHSPKNNTENTYQYGNINIQQPYASGVAMPGSILASNATHYVVDYNATNDSEQAKKEYSFSASEEEHSELTSKKDVDSVEVKEEYTPTEEELKEIRKNEILKQFGAGGSVYKK